MNESGFLVEDGTGLVDANSYVSVESADNYYTNSSSTGNVPVFKTQFDLSAF